MLETYVKKILSSRVYEVADETPLTRAATLSRRLGVDVRLKREDLQPVFSFKLRGAYNKISQLSADELAMTKFSLHRSLTCHHFPTYRL